MNAMIRALKGTLAVLALAGLGLLLRWMTTGSIGAARTYDLDSLTVLAVGTVAWIAYLWLALAVVTTVLEQVPGVVGELAGAVAGRITTNRPPPATAPMSSSGTRPSPPPPSTSPTPTGAPPSPAPPST
jgi:hypothetical protein